MQSYSLLFHTVGSIPTTFYPESFIKTILGLWIIALKDFFYFGPKLKAVGAKDLIKHVFWLTFV